MGDLDKENWISWYNILISKYITRRASCSLLSLKSFKWWRSTASSIIIKETCNNLSFLLIFCPEIMMEEGVNAPQAPKTQTKCILNLNKDVTLKITWQQYHAKPNPILESMRRGNFIEVFDSNDGWKILEEIPRHKISSQRK